MNGSIQLNYNYTAGANNGQIASMTDNVLGQTVSYSYDALKRLSSATSASGGSTVWSQAYSYDGFGNLTAKTGSGWLFSAYSVNSANNRLAGGSIVYDANGNMTTDQNGATYTYDVANRMVSAVVSGGTETYAYDAENKRISKISASGGQTIYIYGAFGEKLAVAAGGGTAGPQNSVGQGGTGPSSLVSVNNVYFAGRLIKQGADASGHPDYYASVYTNVAVDRLGSVLTPVNGQSTPPASTRYLPFGEELAATGNDVVKFATYTRDGSTGLDYADQRFYTSQFGRFMSADPSSRNVNGVNPQSWNRYNYVNGDPVNKQDPNGLCSVAIEGVNGNPAVDTFGTTATNLGANIAYPYSGESNWAGYAGATVGSSDSTSAAYNALLYALNNNSGSIDVVTYSGGATAFAAAFNMLGFAQQQRIGTVLYIAPGGAGQLPAGTDQAYAVFGSGWKDNMANFGISLPFGTLSTYTNCNHTDFACLASAASAQLASIKADGPCNNPNIFTRQNPAGIYTAGGGSSPAPVATAWGYWLGGGISWNWPDPTFSVDSSISFNMENED